MSEEPNVPAPRRGWSSRDLPIVPLFDEKYWSVFDAAEMLGPPTLTKLQVRQLIILARVPAVGKRHNGSSKRHVRVYLACDLLDAFERVTAQAR